MLGFNGICTIILVIVVAILITMNFYDGTEKEKHDDFI